MADKELTTVNSKQLLDQMQRLEQEPHPNIKLGEAAQHILENSLRDIDKIFEYALERITQTRTACDAAEVAIQTKRNVVRDMLTEYVAALQMVETTARDAQQALGDAMLHTDRLGS